MLVHFWPPFQSGAQTGPAFCATSTCLLHRTALVSTQHLSGVHAEQMWCPSAPLWCPHSTCLNMSSACPQSTAVHMQYAMYPYICYSGCNMNSSKVVVSLGSQAPDPDWRLHRNCAAVVSAPPIPAGFSWCGPPGHNKKCCMHP